MVADSVAEAAMLLDDLVANRLRPGVVRGECADPPTTAWFFPGQGSQYPGMARELFDTEPVFADTVRGCAEAVDGMLPRPLLEVLFGAGREAAETLKHTSFAQPAIFAVEMGLARLWQSWGIEPDVVLGHSVGQYAAACVAGVFSLEDGARLIAERGRLFGSLPAGGRMVAVFAEPEYVEDARRRVPAGLGGRLQRPQHGAVRSGRGSGADRRQLQRGRRPLHLAGDQPRLPFRTARSGARRIRVVRSAIHVRRPDPAAGLQPDRRGARRRDAARRPYWRRHSRQPVQFTESVRTVAGLGCSVLMEIGPQPILTAAALQIWPDSSAAPRAIVSLRKGANAQRQITEALATAYIGGHRPDFAAQHHAPRTAARTAHLSVPAPPLLAQDIGHRDGLRRTVSVSGILGSAKDLASGDTVYSNMFSVKTQPWLAHHVIYGTVVVPGATYAAMALAAAGAPARVKEVFFYEPIILPDKALARCS